MKNNKIFIKAYIASNLGDDLFVSILCNRYPNHLFYIEGLEENDNFTNDISNLIYINNDNLSLFNIHRRIRNKLIKTLYRKEKYDYFIEKCDLRVLVSGSYFMESIDSRNKLLDDKYFINSSTYIIGCNFGPFVKKSFLDKYRIIFNDARFLCFRDKYSYSLFQDFKNVDYAPDIVFNYPVENVVLPYFSGYTLVSVTDIIKDNATENIEYLEQYINKHVELIDRIIDCGKNVVLFSFCKSQDLPIVMKIYEKCKKKVSIKLIHYPDISINEAVGFFRCANAIIATRYHALIIALLFKKKIYMFSYNEKINNVIFDLSVNIQVNSLKDIDNISVDEVISYLKIPYSSEDIALIDNYIKCSNKHFAELDFVLGEI